MSRERSGGRREGELDVGRETRCGYFLFSDEEADAGEAEQLVRGHRAGRCVDGLRAQAVCLEHMPSPDDSDRLGGIELCPHKIRPVPGTCQCILIWKRYLCRLNRVQDLEMRSERIKGGLSSQRQVSL